MKFCLDIPSRMKEAVSLAWHILVNKYGNGLFDINKEASMQLQFSVVLNQLIPLITLGKDDSFAVELETGVWVNGKSREIDLVFSSINDPYKIAVEMKCYRKVASSGNSRGAGDIFMKDIYQDISLIESYQLDRPQKGPSGDHIVLTQNFH